MQTARMDLQKGNHTDVATKNTEKTNRKIDWTKYNTKTNIWTCDAQEYINDVRKDD